MLTPDDLGTAIRFVAHDARATLLEIEEDASHRPPKLDAVRIRRFEELSKDLLKLMQENKS